MNVVILQVVVNLAFHPTEGPADVCVIVGVFASCALDEECRQDGG